MAGNARTRVAIAALALSAAGFVGIVTQEGYSDHAIEPVPGDVPTIGFGTTEGVKPGDRITPPRAVARALADASKYEAGLKRCVTAPMHQYEYDAIVSWAYNVGPSAACGSTLVRLLNAERYADACAELLKWDRFKGRPLRGLTIRRQAEYRQCTGSNEP